MSQSEPGSAVLVVLSADEARNAALALDKEGTGAADRAVQSAFGRAFEDAALADGDTLGSFRVDAAHGAQAAATVAEHARERERKGHRSAARKYRSVADEIRHQLIMQGVAVL